MKYVIAFVLASIGSMAFAAEAPIRPDPKLTPGGIFVTASKDGVCIPGYTATVRDVPDSLKKQVFAKYGIDPKSDKFEVDHLISLELGGSNELKNLWPQSYTTQPWNARVKDKLEDRLHAMVCKGQITLEQAQKEISTDWIAAYQKYMSK